MPEESKIKKAAAAAAKTPPAESKLVEKIKQEKEKAATAAAKTPPPAEESKLVEKLKQKVEEEKTPEPEVITFTEDELSALRQVQQDYLECQTAFGQIAVQKIALQQQIDILSTSETDYVEKYSATQDLERGVAKELNDKYGSGNLDPETGIFTPSSK
jgi:hypothetical protein